MQIDASERNSETTVDELVEVNGILQEFIKPRMLQRLEGCSCHTGESLMCCIDLWEWESSHSESPETPPVYSPALLVN